MRARPQGSSRRVLLVVALALVVVGAFLYLRSRGDDSPSAAQLAEKESDCARLLTLRSLLNDPTVVPSSPVVAPRPERVADLVQHVGGGDELVSAAPSKVRDDVRVLVTAVRSQASDPGALRTPAVSEAKQRLAGFLDDPKSGCQTGSESGDG